MIRLGNNEVLKTLTKTLTFVDPNADASTNADARDSTTALRECCSGKLKTDTYANRVDPDDTACNKTKTDTCANSVDPDEMAHNDTKTDICSNTVDPDEMAGNETKTDTCANSVDPDETACNETKNRYLCKQCRSR